MPSPDRAAPPTPGGPPPTSPSQKPVDPPMFSTMLADGTEITGDTWDEVMELSQSHRREHGPLVAAPPAAVADSTDMMLRVSDPPSPF